MQKVAWIVCTAVLALGGSAWAQGFIGGPDFDTSDAVTATSPNWNAGAVADRLVDGSGIDETGEIHDNQGWQADPNTVWLGEGGNVFGNGGGTENTLNPGTYTHETNPNWVRFDFDATYQIGDVRIWNYNGEIPGRGLNQVIVEYSATGGEDPGEWSQLVGDGEEGAQTFPEASGEEDYTGFTLNLNGAEASSVVFTVLRNEGFVKNHSSSGNIGLSEVRFYSGTAIVCDPGDADRDGDVDDDDLSLLLANWGGNVDCTKGEFSGASPVDDDDLSLLLANWTGAVAAVPEPATMALIALGGVALLRRKR